MREIYVVHMHGHTASDGGGGFDWWPEGALEAAVEAYLAETGNAHLFEVMEVNLYRTEVEEELSLSQIDDWVFLNFEVGTPPVEPIAHFVKGEWDAHA